VIPLAPFGPVPDKVTPLATVTSTSPPLPGPAVVLAICAPPATFKLLAATVTEPPGPDCGPIAEAAIWVLATPAPSSTSIPGVVTMTEPPAPVPAVVAQGLLSRLRSVESEPIRRQFLLTPRELDVLALLVALCIPLAWLRWYAAVSLGIVMAHVLAAAWEGPDFLKTLQLLGMAPVYVLRKLWMIPGVVRGSSAKAAWVRTERNNTL